MNRFLIISEEIRLWIILVRGKFVITDASLAEDGILTDGAAYFSGGKVVEVGIMTH